MVTLLVLAACVIAINASAERSLPVDQGVLTSRKGYRPDPFGSGRTLYHRGFDISVPAGSKVYPTQPGIVCFAGWHKGYGYLVAVDHGTGFVTMYGHNSRLKVKVGQAVDTNTVIALAGSTGRSTGPHVHYEVRRWDGRPTEDFVASTIPDHRDDAQVQAKNDDVFTHGDTWADKMVEGL